MSKKALDPDKVAQYEREIAAGVWGMAKSKKKRIAEVVKLIREYANVPLHPDQVTHMGPPGNA